MPPAPLAGGGKSPPPAVLTNADLATFLPTDDDWIVSRTGMKERRISHVCGLQLAHVAAVRALACAGMAAGEPDSIPYGSCSAHGDVAHRPSGIQAKPGGAPAAAVAG